MLYARARLCESLVTDGFPSVDLAAPEECQSILAFLAEAGFGFHLYGDGSERSVALVRDGYARLLDSGRTVGSSVVYRQGGRVRGHLTELRVYSRSWLATHLAVKQDSKDEGERISRALVLGMVDHLESRAGIDFVRFVWRREHRWVNHVFGWSGRAIRQPGLAESFEFTHLVRPAQPAFEPVRGVRVRDASLAEQALVVQHFARNYSPLRRLSEDLEPGRLLLDELRESYASCGLHRARAVRVAEVDGAAAGFALLEEATPTLQLSELTNSVQVFVLPAGEGRGADVRKALLADAAGRTAARGLSHVVALTEERDQSPWLESGFTVAAQARCWIIHRSLMRAWNDVWDVLFGSGRERQAHGKPT